METGNGGATIGLKPDSFPACFTLAGGTGFVGGWTTTAFVIGDIIGATTGGGIGAGSVTAGMVVAGAGVSIGGEAGGGVGTLAAAGCSGAATGGG